MARFRFFLIGSSQPLDVDVSAAGVRELNDLATRARFIEGTMAEPDDDGVCVGVLVQTSRTEGECTWRNSSIYRPRNFSNAAWSTLSPSSTTTMSAASAAEMAAAGTAAPGSFSKDETLKRLRLVCCLLDCATSSASCAE